MVLTYLLISQYKELQVSPQIGVRLAYWRKLKRRDLVFSRYFSLYLTYSFDRLHRGDVIRGQNISVFLLVFSLFSRIFRCKSHIILYVFVSYTALTHGNGYKNGYGFHSADLDFSFQIGERFHLFLSGCLVVDVHRGGNIGVSHDLLYDFEICLVLTETGAEGMTEVVYREMRE